MRKVAHKIIFKLCETNNGSNVQILSDWSQFQQLSSILEGNMDSVFIHIYCNPCVWCCNNNGTKRPINKYSYQQCQFAPACHFDIWQTKLSASNRKKLEWMLFLEPFLITTMQKYSLVVRSNWLKVDINSIQNCRAVYKERNSYWADTTNDWSWKYYRMKWIFHWFL